MVFLDVSGIDRRVRNEVTKRGLFLVSPEEDDRDVYVFVCTDPNPNDCGFTRVGQVVGTGTSGELCKPYVMDGRDTEPPVSLTMLRGVFRNWEDGIKAVLDAYDTRT
ncbi:hypothetical protein CF54_35755 [Streptomyces sp. Tu 6176]|uniref:hypothetical protein n=1 Tax=Streptomyces sp. Tu 6176 TaxID=1470557 RepID=UPI00044B618D|nr:hypothetical protein [Streptomyces sp. Tu 6176]EYT78676.1 hypothetical protein CF54_35755 [Streptomyces sp. Tu 6176]